MEPDLAFRYTPTCSEHACNLRPTAKIAAFWKYGPLSELKNYGLACDHHLEPLLIRARGRRQALAVSDDEQVGQVEAIRFVAAPRPAG